MQIQKNYKSLIEAWQMTCSALHAIKETLLDNAPNVAEAENALYEIMKRNNEWYEEIKKLPF